MRLLIADDEEPIRHLVARCLGTPPFEVVGAADGRQALELAAAGGFDLAVLDVEMPGADGFEVLRALREAPATRSLPIILLTGRGCEAAKVAGLTRGADDYLTKPFSIAELGARVRRLLRRHRQDLWTNPLTGLAGSPALEEEVEKRLAEGRPFALLHVDIDRFKEYNDALGFAHGNEILLETARILQECAAGAFVAHIGGDDFSVVVDAADAAVVAQRLVTRFDERAPALSGGAAAPTLSIGIASTDNGPLDSYSRAAALASELKAYLKSRPRNGLSCFAFDRRRRPSL